MEDYEIFDQILDYVLNGGFGSARNMQHDGMFTDVDPARISQWVKQMRTLAPEDAFVLKTAGGNMPGLWRTDYTHLFKEEGGFKALVQAKQKTPTIIRFNFQKADGSNHLADLHPVVQQVSADLFASNHLTAAVDRAYVALEQQVRALVPNTEEHGMQLMTNVFGLKNPRLIVLQNQAEQLGMMHLFAGAIGGVRNRVAHQNDVITDPQQALEWLMFVSALFRLLDQAQPTKV